MSEFRVGVFVVLSNLAQRRYVRQPARQRLFKRERERTGWKRRSFLSCRVVAVTLVGIRGWKAGPKRSMHDRPDDRTELVHDWTGGRNKQAIDDGMRVEQSNERSQRSQTGASGSLGPNGFCWRELTSLEPDLNPTLLVGLTLSGRVAWSGGWGMEKGWDEDGKPSQKPAVAVERTSTHPCRGGHLPYKYHAASGTLSCG